MIINHNLNAINAHRHMAENVASLSRQSGHLSSGLRINIAADDAAGLAVSEKMRAQVRGLHQAARNVQDSISLIQTAEGWLQETHAILQRMGELSVQAANGTYNQQDRQMIQVEINQLVQEIDRIGSQAEFNTMMIFTGKFADPNTAAQLQQAVATQNTANTQQNQTTGQAQAAAAPTGPLNGLVVHLGANKDQRVSVTIDQMNAETLKLRDATTGILNVSLPEDANRAISTIHEAIVMVGAQRANLGAFQNRLEHAYDGINVATENLQASESRIRDADMAKEMISYVRDEILSTSAASMLAQAHITPQLVLRILR